MFNEDQILPLQISRPWFRAYGLLRLESQVLVLEYQLQDRLLGFLRSGVRTVHLPYLSFHDAHLHKTWRGHRILELKTSSLHPFRAIPGAQQGSCWLEVHRQHQSQAEAFFNLLQLRLSEYHLAQLNAEFEAPLALPEKSWTAQLKNRWTNQMGAWLLRR